MSMFSYWEADNSVSVDAAKDQPLTTDQAHVIATVRMAEELQTMSSALRDLLYFLQNSEIKVHQTN